MPLARPWIEDMTYAAFLWGLVWGGMFTGLYNATDVLMRKSALNYFQGLRAFLPLVAARSRLIVHAILHQRVATVARDLLALG